MGEADSTFFTLSNDGSAVAQHTLGIFYDHRTRPILVTDHDDALNQQQNTAYYYDREDRLIGRVIVPLVGAPNDFTMEWYVQIDPLLTGTDRFVVAGGVATSETLFYTANAPEGLPIAMYRFARTGAPATQVTWRADYGTFGNIRSTVPASGDPLASPWRYRGQIELAGSAAVVWSGAAQLQLREPLALNRWRTYDAHVGQYLSPDPSLRGPIPSRGSTTPISDRIADLSTESEVQEALTRAHVAILSASLTDTSHPLAYCNVDPNDVTDPDGRDPECVDIVTETCSRECNSVCATPVHAAICSAICIADEVAICAVEDMFSCARRCSAFCLPFFPSPGGFQRCVQSCQEACLGRGIH